MKDDEFFYEEDSKQIDHSNYIIASAFSDDHADFKFFHATRYGSTQAHGPVIEHQILAYGKHETTHQYNLLYSKALVEHGKSDWTLQDLAGRQDVYGPLSRASSFLTEEHRDLIKQVHADFKALDYEPNFMGNVAQSLRNDREFMLDMLTRHPNLGADELGQTLLEDIGSSEPIPFLKTEIAYAKLEERLQEKAASLAARQQSPHPRVA